MLVVTKLKDESGLALCFDFAYNAAAAWFYDVYLFP